MQAASSRSTGQTGTGGWTSHVDIIRAGPQWRNPTSTLVSTKPGPQQTRDAGCITSAPTGAYAAAERNGGRVQATSPAQGAASGSRTATTWPPNTNARPRPAANPSGHPRPTGKPGPLIPGHETRTTNLSTAAGQRHVRRAVGRVDPTLVITAYPSPPPASNDHPPTWPELSSPSALPPSLPATRSTGARLAAP